MGSTNIWYFIFIVIVTQQGISGDEIRLDQSPAVIKRPQETVKISCKISGFDMTSYFMHWIRQKPGKALEWIGEVNSGSSNPVLYANSMKDHFTLSEDVSVSTQYLEAKSLREDDTAVYYCVRRVIRGVADAFDYWGKGTMVTVSSAQPSEPQYVFGLSECGSSSDRFLTIGCIAKGFSPADSLTFKWTDSKGQPVNDIVQYPTIGQEGDYTKISHLRVEKINFSRENPYKCEAENSVGKKEAIVAPTAPEPDQRASLYLTSPTNEELDNGTATFICLAKHFSPENHTFKWFHDGVEVKNEGKSDECVGKKKTNVTLFTATSILQLEANMWAKPGHKIKCVFKHKAGDEMKEMSSGDSSTDSCISAHFIPPSWEDMLKNKGGTLTCRASGDMGFQKMEIKIKESGHVIGTSSNKNMANKKTVEISATIGFEEWSNGTQFLCIIGHESKGQPTEIVYVRENGKRDYKRPSVYILAPPEQGKGERVTLTCYVKDFYPMEVFVSWLADDEPFSGYMQNTSMPILNNKTYSVYSQLTLDSSKWENGTVFSCVVYHESINESLRVLTRSISNNSDKPSIFNLSMNIPAICKG